MSKIPANLKYTNDDEWVSVDGDIATIGITDHAQDALSDIVYLELPNKGDFLASAKRLAWWNLLKPPLIC